MAFIIVDDIPVYETVAETGDRLGLAARFVEQGADWLTFSSPSTVTHFHRRFDLQKTLQKFPDLRIASIGHAFAVGPGLGPLILVLLGGGALWGAAFLVALLAAFLFRRL